jgi:hypothetical protein
LQRLAKTVDGGFRVDAYRGIHLWGAAGDTTPKAGTAPQTLTMALSSLKDFRIVTDATQRRTRVIVEGQSAAVAGTVAAGRTIIPLQLGSTNGWNAGASGVARVKSQRFTYTNIAIPANTVGANPVAATWLRSAATAGTTSLDLDSNAMFVGVANKWIQVAEQRLFVTAVSGDNHTVTIPASGVGALTVNLAVTEGVYMLPQLEGCSGMDTDLDDGESVYLRVEVDDTAAQTALAAIEGGDGIHEFYVQDSRLSYDGAVDRANAEMVDSSIEVEWVTDDMNAHPGVNQVVNTSALSTTLPIDEVTITFFPKNNRPPLRRCRAALVRQTSLLDTLVRGTKAVA